MLPFGPDVDPIVCPLECSGDQERYRSPPETWPWSTGSTEKAAAPLSPPKGPAFLSDTKHYAWKPQYPSTEQGHTPASSHLYTRRLSHRRRCQCGYSIKQRQRKI